MNDETIKVCPQCEVPLVFTFCWAYHEMYCLNCGAMGDMFYGRDMEATQELKDQQRFVEALWKVLYGKKGLIPRSSYQKGSCKKCKVDGNHHKHLTDREKYCDHIATELLEGLKGRFAPSPA